MKKRFLTEFIGPNNNDCSSYVDKTVIFLRGAAPISFKEHHFFDFLQKLSTSIKFCIIDNWPGDVIICIGVDGSVDNEELALDIIYHTLAEGDNLFLCQSKVEADEIYLAFQISILKEPPFEVAFNRMEEKFWEHDTSEHYLETNEVERMLEMYNEPIALTKSTAYEKYKNKLRNSTIGIPLVSYELQEEIAAHPSIFEDIQVFPTLKQWKETMIGDSDS